MRKPPEKSEEEKEKIKFADKVGTAEKAVKDLKPSKQMKQIENLNAANLLTQTSRPKRSVENKRYWADLVPKKRS